MDQNTFQVLYDDATQCLESNRLLKALDALDGLVALAADWDNSQKLKDLRQAYAMMLEYMRQGIEDPQREQMYKSFYRKAYEIRNATYFKNYFQYADNAQAAARRTLDNLSRTITFSDITDPATSYRNIFDLIWTSAQLTTEQERIVADALESKEVGRTAKCLIISAMMMSALSCFDVAKMKIMLNLCEQADVQIRARALVGFVMVFIEHEEQAMLYPELAAQWSLFLDRQGARNDVLALQLQLLLSLETKNIAKSLQEDILPEMMKNARKYSENGNIDIEQFNAEMTDLGLNPEWENDANNKELGKKIKSIIEWQQKGADVYMSSFSMLKQRFPFFDVVANWFCPYDENHPDLHISVPMRDFTRLLTNSVALCSSDKYSFCLVLAEMPAQNIEMLKGQIEGMIEGKDLELDFGDDGQADMNVAIRVYLQDLYRFFCLYRRRAGLPNPFANNLLLTDYALLKDALHEPDMMRQVADFAFEEKNYGIACSLFEELLQQKEANAVAWQKTGYCHQRLNNYEKAAEAYERSLLLEEKASPWTVRQLAACYRAMQQYDKALRYTLEMLQEKPDDIDRLLRAGECYMHLADYDKALELLYKADYLAEKPGKTTRALAWTALKAKRLDVALKNYNRILEDKPLPEDFLNAAHAEWLSDNMPDAVRHYRQYLKLNPSVEDPFAADVELLKDYGKSELDIALMADALMA